jgi:hypothetical protein
MCIELTTVFINTRFSYQDLKHFYLRNDFCASKFSSRIWLFQYRSVLKRRSLEDTKFKPYTYVFVYIYIYIYIYTYIYMVEEWWTLGTLTSLMLVTVFQTLLHSNYASSHKCLYFTREIAKVISITLRGSVRSTKTTYRADVPFSEHNKTVGVFHGRKPQHTHNQTVALAPDLTDHEIQTGTGSIDREK